ncbi:MAG: hypothetical protein QME58_02630 [Bacteroidota bacterium]|nr:hypothetical protein [Bacteroidota bacterium]
MNTKILFTLIVVAVGISACSKDSTSMMGSLQNANIIVEPKDGTAGVRLDAGITISFAKSIDRAVVENNLHLISQFAMADSLCPISDSMGHGMMDNVMMDSMKMNHLMSQHRSSGQFQWNGNNTQCILQPDSMMMPNMRYMIHMGSEMVKMMESQMGNMNMMGNHGTGMTASDMFFHFTTIDTTQVGTGHDSHH